MSAELDNLEIQKRKLEIEKLQREIKTEHFFPAKKLTVWQAIVPPLLTVTSVILTGLILLNLNVFDVNNKLLEIRRDSLRHEISNFVTTRNKLQARVDELMMDSINLSNRNFIYDSVLRKAYGSMSEQQRQISILTIDNKNLKEEIQISIKRLMGGSAAAAANSISDNYSNLLEENKKLREQVGELRLNVGHYIQNWDIVVKMVKNGEPTDHIISILNPLVDDLRGAMSR